MVDCWTCGAERGRAIFCPTCKAIQPVVRNTSYFELLGLPPKMTLSRDQLEQAYREVSKQVHPDRFGRGSGLERKLALEQTTFSNDAYRTLKSARSRAEYLMKLRGRPVLKEEHRVTDLELLDRMMEIREHLANAKSAAEVAPLREQVLKRHDALLEQLRAFFDEDRGTLDDAQKAIEELRFLERFLEEVEARFEPTLTA